MPAITKSNCSPAQTAIEHREKKKGVVLVRSRKKKAGRKTVKGGRQRPAEVGSPGVTRSGKKKISRRSRCLYETVEKFRPLSVLKEGKRGGEKNEPPVWDCRREN